MCALFPAAPPSWHASLSIWECEGGHFQPGLLSQGESTPHALDLGRGYLRGAGAHVSLLGTRRCAVAARVKLCGRGSAKESPSLLPLSSLSPRPHRPVEVAWPASLVAGTACPRAIWPQSGWGQSRRLWPAQVPAGGRAQGRAIRSALLGPRIDPACAAGLRAPPVRPPPPPPSTPPTNPSHTHHQTPPRTRPKPAAAPRPCAHWRPCRLA